MNEDKLTTVKCRLIKYLKYKRISKTEFGKAIGVSCSYVTSIRTSIPTEKIEKIRAVYPDLSIEWLMSGRGNMLQYSENYNNSVHKLQELERLLESKEETIESNKLVISSLSKALSVQDKRIADLEEKIAVLEAAMPKKMKADSQVKK